MATGNVWICSFLYFLFRQTHSRIVIHNNIWRKNRPTVQFLFIHFNFALLVLVNEYKTTVKCKHFLPLFKFSYTQKHNIYEFKLRRRWERGVRRIRAISHPIHFDSIPSRLGLDGWIDGWLWGWTGRELLKIHISYKKQKGGKKNNNKTNTISGTEKHDNAFKV